MNRDLFWLKDESLEDFTNVLAPEVIQFMRGITMPMYTLAKIDVTDAIPTADFFDDERYAILEEGVDLDHMLRTAVGGFIHENPKMKSYDNWLQKGEDGGYEFIIYTEARELFRASSTLVSQEIFNSIPLIVKHHSGAKRKGDGHPYMEHVLDVGRRLWKSEFGPEVIAAGYCHDLLEDTECAEEEIWSACGDEVLRIVKAVTNDESMNDLKDWERKKTRYIETVRAGGERAIAVSVADKISNLHSFFAQYEKEGPNLWKKFNRGKDKKVWFEKEVLKMAREHWAHPLISELGTLIVRLEQTDA